MIWLNGDDSELEKKTYKEGQTEPTTDKVATKAADADYTYAFSKWDDGTVEGSTKTYRPEFTRTAVPAPVNPTTPAVQPTAGTTSAASAGSTQTTADFCSSTITGIGDGIVEYARHSCAEHQAVADRADALVARAETDEELVEAWQKAAGLWREALDAEYAGLLASGRADRTAIEAERARFEALVEAMQTALALEHPDDPALVSRRIAEALKRRTAQLCYALGTAPAARADIRKNAPEHVHEGPEAGAQCRGEADGATFREVLCDVHRALEADMPATAGEWLEAKERWLDELDRQVSERRLGASDEGRAAIDAEREAFIGWLDAREVLLHKLYPGQDAVVNELMAGAVRTRALEMCEEL